MRPLLLLIILLSALSSGPALAETLQSPTLHLHNSSHHGERIALTLDACGGKTDERILDALIDNRIKATIFVTGRWLKRNQGPLARLLAHPDLFEIENHGAQHLAAVDWPTRIFGVKAAGSPDALHTEISDGAALIKQATGHAPHWYRGATALYSEGALKLINSMDYHIAGFSLSGDGGAMFSASRAEHAILSAKDGDVIIAHINQPTRVAGEGVAKAIVELKKRGVIFVRLDEDK